MFYDEDEMILYKEDYYLFKEWHRYKDFDNNYAKEVLDKLVEYVDYYLDSGVENKLLLEDKINETIDKILLQQSGIRKVLGSIELGDIIDACPMHGFLYNTAFNGLKALVLKELKNWAYYEDYDFWHIAPFFAI